MKKAFINPGHAPGGNPDPGAIGPTGLQENAVNLSVGRFLADELKQKGIQTIELLRNQRKQNKLRT